MMMMKIQSVVMYELVSVIERLPFKNVSSTAFNC